MPWSENLTRIIYEPCAGTLHCSISYGSAPKSTSPVERIASEVAQLVRGNHDVCAVLDAIAEIEKERRGGIEKALRGTLDTAKPGSAKSRRFRLAFHEQSNGAVIVEGVEFADGRADTSKEDAVCRVYLAELPYLSGFPARQHHSLDSLRKQLAERGIVHVINYID